MNKQIEALKMAIELENLIDRFNEGWHEGIEIDASDIMLLTNIREALEQPAQKPDYWLGYGLQAHDEKPYDEATPLYLRPAQPLSDDEIKEVCIKAWDNGIVADPIKLARAIEQAHGIGVKDGQAI